MRVKRFVANNIQEAMLQVKIEMGKDAVILHTRRFKEGGFLGLFSKEFVEVTAAVDNDFPSLKPEPKEVPAQTQIVWPQITEQKLDLIGSQPNNNEAVVNEDFMNEDLADEETDSLIDSQNGSDDLQEMKKLMQDMILQIENASLNFGLNRIGEQFYHSLVKNEVEEKLAKRLVKRCLDNIPSSKYEDMDYIQKSFTEIACRILKKPKPINLPKKKKQQVFALVGPTGVGKTTTIAKLAANFTINNQKNIALITSDTYRIAAVEQLKTVGDIIGIPVEVVFTPQNMKNSIIQHSDKDLVFIDTAGRSHKNALHLGELKGFLDAAEPDEIFLVLSATTKYKDMLEIIETYEKINFNRIIFTKLDETTTYGPILSIIHKSRKYLSYFTTGQSVPDDIEIAQTEKIVGLILRGGVR
ncbi:MAG: flagellar biosynthesis protein FlhF [Bacillota bacterium]